MVIWKIWKGTLSNSIEKIKAKLKTNIEIKVVNDQFGNLTSTKTVIKVIEKYLRNELPNGIYNVQNNDEVVSRYDIACYIVEQLKSKCKVVPCKTSDYVLPAKRQLNSNLDTSKIRQYLELPKWKDELKDYLNEQ